MPPTLADRTEVAPVTSYEEYVTLRWAALYRTAYLMTGAHADAEDLVQTTLVKVYAAWDRVARADSPDAYVRRTLVNCFVSGRRPMRVSRERVVAAVPDAGAAPEGPDERLSLWPHVMALPPKQRAVVVLRYWEDLTEQQIADALGCSTGTVKSNASLAMRSLRARMADLPEGGDR
jgi:RNA polymerase sigma-70 factor (sigma-E family)